MRKFSKLFLIINGTSFALFSLLLLAYDPQEIDISSLASVYMVPTFFLVVTYIAYIVNLFAQSQRGKTIDNKIRIAEQQNSLKTTTSPYTFLDSYKKDLVTSKNLDLQELEELRQKYVQLHSVSIILLVIGFILSFVVIGIPILIAGLVLFFIETKTYQQFKIESKVYLLQCYGLNGLNVKLYDTKNQDNIMELLKIKKLAQDFFEYNYNTAYIDDYWSFDYKKKEIEVIDFSILDRGNKNQVEAYKASIGYHFLCFTTTNPNKAKAITAASSYNLWNFSKIGSLTKTESMKFNNLFEVYSENPIEARLHLKTNVMEDMIDMITKLNYKKIAIYFDKDKVYFIISTPYSALEIDPKMPLTAAKDQLKELEKDINQVLQIFDHFWLDRGSF